MIIAGGSRSSARFWTWHLQRTDGGQSVAVRDSVGLMGQDMGEWFAQMEAMSAGGKTDNYFYHFNLNPREDEPLTPEQLKVAVATTLENLGLQDQPYFLVEHDKDGRSPHYHCIVLRVDLDSGKAISDSQNYRVHMRTADDLEQRFAHQRTERGRGPDGPNPKGYEVQRGQETGIDPKAVAAELKALWHQCDTGKAFAAALEQHGYILARGDRRAMVVIDAAGDEHSLGRRVGARAAEVRSRMQAVDPESLPTVAEARALARDRADRREEPDQPLIPDPAAGADPGRPDRPSIELPAEEALEEPTYSATEPAPALPAVTATGDDAPAERSAFDRYASAMKQALREGRGEPSVAKGSRWLAARAPQPSARPEYSPFGRFARAMKDALRARGGEPHTGDGLSFWQRSAAVLSATLDQATSWVKRVYRDVATRFSSRDNPGPDDPGMER